MVKNLSESLANQDRGDRSLDARNNTHITSVIALISTMREICQVSGASVHLFICSYRPLTQETLQGLDPGTVIRANYILFCKQIFDILSRYPALFNHHRLTTLIAWLRNVS